MVMLIQAEFRTLTCVRSNSDAAAETKKRDKSTAFLSLRLRRLYHKLVHFSSSILHNDTTSYDIYFI